VDRAKQALSFSVQEKYLLELRGSGAAPTEGAEEGAEGDESEPVLTVHPECDIVA
jgi:hypothetical protein